MDISLHEISDETLGEFQDKRFPFSDLPVINFVADILKTIRKSDVTIISAETGAGKSTVIPWYLFAVGNLRTWVTEPRRVAAESLAGYVSAKNETELGSDVGVRTAIQAKSSDNTKLLYATDGWVLRKFLNIKKNDQHNLCNVLILDEVHEENKNLDLLIGLWKKWKSEEIKVPKLVLMSATIAIDSLNKCFKNPPIFQIQGRTFDVEKHWEPNKNPIDIIIDEVGQGRDCMVFLAGKYEIQEMQEILREKGLGAEILQLHREVEWPEQKKVFDKYERPKVILCTDIGQTSITPDVDTVISLGIKRRVSLFDGIQRLCDMLCAEFDLIQQAGRAGRTKPDGKFILCSDVPSRMFIDAYNSFRGEKRKRKRRPSDPFIPIGDGLSYT